MEEASGMGRLGAAALLEALPDAALVALPSGVVTHVNKACCALFGCESSELVGSSVQEIETTGAGNLSAMLASGDPRQKNELTLRRRDASSVDAEVIVTPLQGEGHFLVTLRDMSIRRRAERELQESNDMLATLSRAQSQFIVDGNPRDSFNELLKEVLRLTESAYGFIGEIFLDEDAKPYLKAHAITNISWSPETHAIFDQSAATGLEFRNLRTLFGAVITTGQAVIANAPAVDPRRGGLPAGHPPLEAFAGLPFSRNGRLLGMIGIANRRSGYDDNIVKRLEPFLSTCAALTEAYRSERSRKLADEALGDARAYLAAALYAGGIGLWTWHPAEKRVTWDKSASDLFGRPL